MHHDDPIPPLKRQLGATVAALTQEWSVGEAASLMCTDRWRVTDIRAGRLERFSLEALIRFAYRLGREVTVHADQPRSYSQASRTERATGSPQR